jgi:hypothetical protein
MDELVRLNVSGEYRSGPRQRGFVCKVGGRTRQLRGLTKLTHRLFKRQQHTPLSNGSNRLVLLPPGTVPLINTMRVGTAVHRHVMHAVMCTPLGACRCKVATGAAPGRLNQQCVSVRACVSSARTFVREYRLEPVIGEPVIYIGELGLATRPDALFRPVGAARGPRGPIVLVSWKSGAGPRTEAEYREHWAQVKLERSGLVNTHHVNVVASYVVYLTAARDMSSMQVQAFYCAHKVD